MPQKDSSFVARETYPCRPQKDNGFLLQIIQTNDQIVTNGYCNQIYISTAEYLCFT